MLRRLFLLGAVAAALGLAAFWFLTIPATVPTGALGPYTPDLANGETMFLIGGCSSCHAVPKQEDSTRLGGGLGLVSPFGTFYVPNISPDTKDGIGGWTEAQFITAMTKGTSPDGEHLFPVFPYTSFHWMKSDDLRDLFADIMTMPPVAGKVRDHDVPFPLNIRRMAGGWKLLYLDGEPFKSDPSKSEQWNRGAYLVNGPGHCAECHSPRNVLGAIVAGKRFSGHGGFPNITQFKLKNWSEADIAETLETGMTADGARVGGPMVEVVRNTSQLSAEDRAAMAAYIKSLPPIVQGDSPKPVDTNAGYGPAVSSPQPGDTKTAAAAPDAANGSVEVEVTVKEYTVEMTKSIGAGPTTFKVTNAGKETHGFEIEGNGIEKEIEPTLQQGESGSLRVDLKPGTYKVYCPVKGHKMLGMSLNLTVK